MFIGIPQGKQQLTDRKVNNNLSTDFSQVDRKVNNDPPFDQTEGANSSSIETNISPQRKKVEASSGQNNNSSSSMGQEGHN